jgi:hypothetical protein
MLWVICLVVVWATFAGEDESTWVVGTDWSELKVDRIEEDAVVTANDWENNMGVELGGASWVWIEVCTWTDVTIDVRIWTEVCDCIDVWIWKDVQTWTDVWTCIDVLVWTEVWICTDVSVWIEVCTRTDVSTGTVVERWASEDGRLDIKDMLVAIKGSMNVEPTPRVMTFEGVAQHSNPFPSLQQKAPNDGSPQGNISTLPPSLTNLISASNQCHIEYILPWQKFGHVEP